MNLHNEIMNIQVESEKIPQGKFIELPYKLGHRDARHAAAELSLKAEARIEELEAENAELRKDAERFRYIELDADSGMSKIYGEDWISVIDSNIKW